MNFGYSYSPRRGSENLKRKDNSLLVLPPYSNQPIKWSVSTTRMDEMLAPSRGTHTSRLERIRKSVVAHCHRGK